jgi:uncharacterized protein YbjT (DUF2867 family)
MKKVLVIGATGYVGGRLVPRLRAAGYAVRCMARDPRKLEGRGWGEVEVVRGDVLDPVSLAGAVRGCSVLYYLVHSMGPGEGSFEERDRRGAENTARAAAAAGVERIVYLGGLGRRTADLSPHLRSRNEVGSVLAAGPVPVTEFRAAMVIGSGSASFEMMHALVNRLPVMTSPKWVSTRSQPVAVADVLRYLVECPSVPASAGAVIDIGGPDILTYREMMLRFARLLGLRRWIIVVPVLTPRLSSLWINFVTPIPASLARPLVEGLKSEMVCENDLASRLFPWKTTGFDEAVARALSRVREMRVETRWSDAAVPAEEEPLGAEHSQLLSDVRRLEVPLPAAAVARSFCSIGGTNGWYYGDVLWELRGFIDRLTGGVGLRRGRRHPTELVAGEALDFWRVEKVVPGELLLLRAEMKVPGRAWLEFRAEPTGPSACTLTQTARFYPRGVWGLLYWYSVYPLHQLVFAGMARAVVRRAAPVRG